MSMTISGMGRLGADPKMSFTPQGTAQTLINVAVKTGFGDKQKTVWCSLICWGGLAETVNKFLEKGNRVFFTADVTEVRAYEKKDESVGATLDAKLLTIDFFDQSKKESEEEPEAF